MSDYPFFFTWSKQKGTKPMEIVGGQGARFTTADGGEWIDMAALSFQANLGHGHPRMIAAIKAQADRLCLTSPNALYPEKTALAKELLALAPKGFDRVFFTLGGSESTENAIKIARLAAGPGRFKLVSRYRSYHGASMGALTLSGDYRRPPVEPGLPGVVHALEGVDYGELMDAEGASTIAALFLESVPGANGVLVPTPEWFQNVRRACTERGVLLVIDEVLTGFGRTGRWFGYEHFGVEPDMIALAKGLTGGYGTLGAVLVHERVSRAFDERVLFAGLTAYAHPIGVGTALEAIKVYRDERLIDRAATLEAPFLGGMRHIGKKLGKVVKDVRGIGLLATFELDVSPTADLWGRLDAALTARRVYTHVRKQSSCLILSPPLNITDAELDDGLARVEAAMKEVLS